MLVPLGQGIAASIIAALMICAWIAIGSAFLGKRRSDDEICAPAAILIGSGATSFVLALFCAGGMVGTGVLAVSIASCAVALRRYRAVADILSGVLRPYRAALSSDRWNRSWRNDVECLHRAASQRGCDAISPRAHQADRPG
jgi:hypothetical protein